MHNLRPTKESLKPSPALKDLPDMCEKLAKNMCVTLPWWPVTYPTTISNYLGSSKTEMKFLCSISPTEWAT